VGFQREGVLREDCYREGRYGSTIAMAMLRSDWDARHVGIGNQDSGIRDPLPDS